MAEEWKGIKIPKRLQSNWTMKNGMPLPYVAEFAEGEQDMTWMDNIPYMACECIIGIGEPLPGKQCPARNRRCIGQRICGACGKAVKPTSFIYFAGAHRLQYFSEPGTHYDCMLFSLKACTGIRRHAEGMSIVRARTYDVWWERFLGVDWEGNVVTNKSKPYDNVVTTNGLPAPVGMFWAQPHIIERTPVNDLL